MTRAGGRNSFLFLKIALLVIIGFSVVSPGYASKFKVGFTQIYFAEQTGKKGSEPVEVEIFLIDYQEKGKLRIGLYFKIEPGWYLYWLNPGEAGLPPQVEWKLPQGFSLTNLEFPSPEKFLSSGYVVYGYKKELLILANFSTPEAFSFPAREATFIQAKLNWMVCQESCLIGQKQLELDLSSVNSRRKEEAYLIWEKFKSRFPRPQEEIRIKVKNVKMMKAEEGGPYGEIKISLELEGEDLWQVKDFYPLPLDDFIIDENVTKYNDGTIELSLTPLKNGARIDRLRGLLIGEKSSYLVDFTVSESPLDKFVNSLEKNFVKIKILRRLKDNGCDHQKGNSGFGFNADDDFRSFLHQSSGKSA